MREQWKDVYGYEGLYQVSSHGRVRSLRRIVSARWEAGREVRDRDMSTFDRGNGYPAVRLSRHGKAETVSVHQIVCRAFHGPPPSDKHIVAHGDGVVSNNAVGNLRWATHSENCMDRHLHGTAPVGEKNSTSKLTDVCVHMMRAMRRSGNYTYKEIAEKFGVTHQCCMSAVKGYTWSHLPGAIK